MGIKMRLPDVIGIGSPRSGTTWLSNLLNHHPDIYFAPYFKEIHFFDNNYKRGLKWYSKFYHKIPENKICFDYTPGYMKNYKIGNLIKQMSPNIKLIVCIRNPIQRAFSHYMQRNRFENWEFDFDKTVQYNSKNILDYGLYGSQLKKVLENFSKEQIHIIFFEDLITNTENIISDVFNFLEIPNFKVEINTMDIGKNSMKKIHFKPLKQTIRFIRSLCRKYYLFRIIFYQLFPGDKMLKFISKINTKNQILTKTNISIKTKKYLKEYYCQDKILLEQILGREIVCWDD